jgi:RNA polymerase sigma-70 factor (ECF subfamily)
VDRGLVALAQQGDRDAYEALARGSARRLYLIAYRIARDVDQAEDAVQRTLIAIWQDLPSLRDPDRFDAWTYRILVRFCEEESRRRRRIGVTIVDLSEAMVVASNDGADIAVRDQLERAFASLSHAHRAVIVLHHFAGLSLGEIADVLDIPYGTVGSRLHHALRAMRASIESTDRQVIRGGQPA